MRTTIRINILTKAQRAAVSMMYCGLSTVSEVFLIFTTQIDAQLRHLKCTLVKD